MRVSGQNRNLGAPPFSPLRQEGGRVGAPPFDSAQGMPFSPPRREGGNRRPHRNNGLCSGKRFPDRTLTGRAGKKARGQGRQSLAKTSRTAHRSSALRVPTPNLRAPATPSSTLTLIRGVSPIQAKSAFPCYESTIPPIVLS